MKLVLLPGLDGTGELFSPFLSELPNNIDPIVISYPLHKELTYVEIVNYIMGKLPKEDFIILCESFSGPVAYQIALSKPRNLKKIIFVATFLSNPRPILLGLSCLIPRTFILSIPIPKFVMKFLMLGHDANDQLLNCFQSVLKAVPAKIISFRLNEITKLKENLAPCDVSATYIQATNDKLVPAKCFNTFKAKIKKIKVVKINGPHFILQARPSACLNVVINELYDL